MVALMTLEDHYQMLCEERDRAMYRCVDHVMSAYEYADTWATLSHLVELDQLHRLFTIMDHTTRAQGWWALAMEADGKAAEVAHMIRLVDDLGADRLIVEV